MSCNRFTDSAVQTERGKDVLAEKNLDSYTAQVGSDPVILAQYAYEPIASTHLVTVVGWDDSFAAANVFTIEEDSVLQYISAMTGDMNTKVTASVYLLSEDSAHPADGKLLACTTETFRFAGYHRLELNGSLLLPAGSRIGVVILESVPVSGGVKYALVNTGSMNLKGVEAHNAGAGQYGVTARRYAKGIVNAGESFVSLESGKWMDWADAIAVFGSGGSGEGVAYDNPPVKAYIYPLAEVEKVHSLSERIPTNGGEAAICPEDGYLLLDVAK